MANLSRKTIQSLAVLRAVSQWRNGAYGPLRIHKTLFFADQANDPDWTLFTFKRWFLGQYSDEISETLNDLQTAGRIRGKYDGPSERIIALLSAPERLKIRLFFSRHFRDWERGFIKAFPQWAYLTNDALIKKAHDDPSYKQSQHGLVIVNSQLSDLVSIPGLSEIDAERLSDMVNGRLQSEISKRLNLVVSKQVVDEDWESIYFGDD